MSQSEYKCTYKIRMVIAKSINKRKKTAKKCTARMRSKRLYGSSFFYCFISPYYFPDSGDYKVSSHLFDNAIYIFNTILSIYIISSSEKLIRALQHTEKILRNISRIFSILIIFLGPAYGICVMIL